MELDEEEDLHGFQDHTDDTHSVELKSLRVASCVSSPVGCCGCFWFILAAMAGFAVYDVFFPICLSFNFSDFKVINSDISNNYYQKSLAENTKFSALGARRRRRRMTETSETSDRNGNIRRLQDIEGYTLWTSKDFYYRAIAAIYLNVFYYSKNTNNILTKELLGMCHDIEQGIKDFDGYHTHSLIYKETDADIELLFPGISPLYLESNPGSFLNYIYPQVILGSYVFNGNGGQLTLEGGDLEETIRKYNDVGDLTDFFDFSFDFINVSSKYLAAVYPFGYQSKNESKDELYAFVSSYKDKFFDKLHKRYAKEIGIAFADSRGVILENELYFYLGQDLNLAVWSLVVIFVVVYLYCRSVYITALGLLGVCSSFIPCFAIFVMVWGESFNLVNMVSLWVILGIGCDDICVFISSYRRAPLESMNGQIIPNHLRLAFAYREAGSAMFVTSFTTACSFFSLCLSSINPLPQFGWFLGSLVLCNFVLVMSWFPCILQSYVWFVMGCMKCKCHLQCCNKWLAVAVPLPDKHDHGTVEKQNSVKVLSKRASALVTPVGQRQSSVPSYGRQSSNKFIIPGAASPLDQSAQAQPPQQLVRQLTRKLDAGAGGFAAETHFSDCTNLYFVVMRRGLGVTLIVLVLILTCVFAYTATLITLPQETAKLLPADTNWGAVTEAVSKMDIDEAQYGGYSTSSGESSGGIVAVATSKPTKTPTEPRPTAVPSSATPSPTTLVPTRAPTPQPSAAPVTPSPTPTPTALTTAPSDGPSGQPTPSPSQMPTLSPAVGPTPSPLTLQPTVSPLTLTPTKAPSDTPTAAPITAQPSMSPLTLTPTSSPSKSPSLPAATELPTSPPVTSAPTRSPSDSTSTPTHTPSNNPSQSPTKNPTDSPSAQPTFTPTNATNQPSVTPTAQPSITPSSSPSTAQPTGAPSRSPSNNPSQTPSNNPSVSPTNPTSTPSTPPTNFPTHSPTYALPVQPSFRCLNDDTVLHQIATGKSFKCELGTYDSDVGVFYEELQDNNGAATFLSETQIALVFEGGGLTGNNDIAGCTSFDEDSPYYDETVYVSLGGYETKWCYELTATDATDTGSVDFLIIAPDATPEPAWFRISLWLYYNGTWNQIENNAQQLWYNYSIVGNYAATTKVLSTDEALAVSLVFGTRKVSEFVTNCDGEVTSGTLTFDRHFDIYHSEAQQRWLDLCAELGTIQDSVMYRIDDDQVPCFAAEFEEYLNVTHATAIKAISDRTSFNRYISEFVQERSFKDFDPRDFKAYFGTAEDEEWANNESSIAWVSQTVNTQIGKNWGGAAMYEYYLKWEDFIQDFNQKSEGSFQGLQTSSGYIRMEVEVAFLDGFVKSVLYTIILCAVVMIFFTQNLYLVLLVCLYILIICVWVVGLFGAVGWPFGIIEIISVPTVVGLTIDYALHITHAYIHSPFPDRVRRAKSAVNDLGSSVFASAMTTISSMLILYFATIIIFSDLGWVVGSTTSFGVALALFVCPACLMFTGPEYDQCHFSWFCPHSVNGIKCGKRRFCANEWHGTKEMNQNKSIELQEQVQVQPVQEPEQEQEQEGNDNDNEDSQNDLANGWKAVLTDDGKVYYQNGITQETQWTKPVPIAIEAEAAVTGARPAVTVTSHQSEVDPSDDLPPESNEPQAIQPALPMNETNGVMSENAATPLVTKETAGIDELIDIAEPMTEKSEDKTYEMEKKESTPPAPAAPSSLHEMKHNKQLMEQAWDTPAGDAANDEMNEVNEVELEMSLSLSTSFGPV